MSESRFLHITTNRACNLNCIYCCEWVRKNGSLLDDIIRWETNNNFRNTRISEDLIKGKNYFNGVVFSSGEPTLNQSLEEHVSLAHELWYKKIELVTNGIRISDKVYLQKLQNAWLNSLVISINSFDVTISKYVSWNDYTGKKTLIWIINAILLNIPLSINIVITKYTLISLKQTLFILKKVGVNNILLSFIRYNGFNDKLYKWLNRIEKNCVTYEDFIKYFIYHDLNDVIEGFQDFTLNDFPICVLKRCNIWFSSFKKSKDFNFFDRLNAELKELPEIGIKRVFLKECKNCHYKDKCCWVENDYYKIFWKEQLKREICKIN